MGTMASTLILAVFGGSLGTWVLDYVYDLPFLQLLRYSQSQKKGFALSEALLFPLYSFSCRAASPAQCMSWPFSDTATTPALPPS